MDGTQIGHEWVLTRFLDFSRISSAFTEFCVWKTSPTLSRTLEKFKFVKMYQNM